MIKVTEQNRTRHQICLLAITDRTCTTPPGHALFWDQATFYIPCLSLQDRCHQQQGRTGVLPNQFTARFCCGTVLGHKDNAEKSSFLPAEGSGTHKPASKCVRSYCKREIEQNKTNGAITIIKKHCLGGNITKLNIFFHLHSLKEEMHQTLGCSHYLHPSSVTSSSSVPFRVLGRDTLRQQQGQNSLFLNISTRNPSSSLCGAILLSSSLPEKSLNNFKVLFPLFSLLLSCCYVTQLSSHIRVLMQQRNMLWTWMWVCVNTKAFPGASTGLAAHGQICREMSQAQRRRWQMQEIHSCSHLLSTDPRESH